MARVEGAMVVPQFRSFGSTLREASVLQEIDPRSLSFGFCPYEKLVPQFRSFGLTLREASTVWVVLPCVRSSGFTLREASAVRPLFLDVDLLA